MCYGVIDVSVRFLVRQGSLLHFPRASKHEHQHCFASSGFGGRAQLD